MSYCLRCGEKTPWWKFWGVHTCRPGRNVQMVSEHPVRRSGPVKLSELRQIEHPTGDDMLLIVDTSEQESKKISMAQLKAFIKS